MNIKLIGVLGAFAASLVLIACSVAPPNPANSRSAMTVAEVLEHAPPSHWRQPDPNNLVELKLAQGSVLFELAPRFAPKHVANLKQLLAQHYFDGLAVVRVQDNYVAQWGDPMADSDQARDLGSANVELPAEFYRSRSGLPVRLINSQDAYAERVGFVEGFPIGTDGDRAWLTHCYGALGVARDVDPDSGNSSGLYMVIGHAPRHLDRNVTLIGRALRGAEHLAALPRGTGILGFYGDLSAGARIAMRNGSELAEDERNLEILRTDSSSFANYVAARAHRIEDWFADSVGKIGLCNVLPPVRNVKDS